MNNVVNLNRFRKKKARAGKEKQADENRSRHGRTKAERHKAAQEEESRNRRLDGHALGDDDGAV
ncbi:DUF4169 family protein [Hyphococcus sp.]|uniref:DUF4169 family protein n=1 Tax=Hyphococcus sp. TaxID=2038636 RepID=UPI003CCBEBFD